MFERLSRLLFRRPQGLNRRSRRPSRWLEVDLLEKRDLLTAFTPGNLVILQVGDGTTAYNAQAPLVLDEITTAGTPVQGLGATSQAPAIPAVGAANITAATATGTNVSITTTVAPGLTSNGFTNNEYIAIAGITPSGYDGIFQITVTSNTSFTYTVPSGLGNITGFTGATATPGQVGNQPITIDLSAAAGNGQLTRSYDGSALTFDGIDSTVNNGGLTAPTTPTGQNNRVVGVLTGDPAITSNINTTTDGPFYVGDDNRGSVAESPTGAIYTAGHPNQAGGAVSQGVHYFATEGAAAGTQVSASTNIRGINIGFDNRMYFSTAGGLGGATALNTAGIFTEAQALPTDANATPANDIQIVPAIFSASKLGGLFLADMNGDGIIDNGDRLYFLDDGTVGGAGTGGLYVATWNDAITANPWNTPNNAAAVAAGLTDHWSVPVRLGDAPVQTGSGGVGQLRGLTGTVINSNEVDLYTSAFDNAAGDSSFIQQWIDTSTGVAIANAKITSGTTVQITTLTPNSFADGATVQIDGVGANNGAGAITSGYNGTWTIHVIDSTHFTYSDTNSGASSLSQVNNQGAADVIVNPNTIATLPGGSVTIAGKTFADVGLRGVSFAPVAATNVSLKVNGGGSATVSPGTNVTFTATLTNAQVGAAGLNGDTVTFIDQNTMTVIGQATISTTGGVTTASFTTTTPLVGNHVVSAYFAGGGTDALASATSGTVVVNEAGNTVSGTTVTSSLAAVAIGKQVTLTATVTTGATGTVSFYNGSVSLANLLGTSALNAASPNKATLTAVFSTAGAQTITAVYNGDNTYASSQGSTTVNVGANATATITASANNVAVGSVQTFTATLNGNAVLGAPGGSVVFTIVSATTNSSGVPVVSATSSAIALTGSGTTASALWTGPALTAPGSYFVTISYTASGTTNPYSSFAINTTNASNGVALVETAKQAFTPGNLVAVQRGDGSVNLGSAGYLVFLDEYTTSGTLVQSIALPNLDAGTTHALLLSGQNGAEGLLNRSANGYYLTVAGYDLPVGHTFVTSTFPFQFPRTIARIDLSGNLNTSTAISTTSSSSVPYNPLDVVSNDGNEFWLASNLPVGDVTDSGIEYVGSVGATTGTQIGPVNVGAAAIAISGGQLYVTKGAGDIQSVGSGLPTTAGQTLTGLPGLAAAYSGAFPNAENPEQILLLNTNDGTSNNPNVAYIADQANGLLKFWFDGTNWNYGGPGGTFGQKLVFAGGVTGVVGFVVNPGANAQIQLYVTGSNVQQQNPNQLDSFLDTHGGPINSGTNGIDKGFPGGNFTKLSFVGGSNPTSPNGNENFSGLAFVPGYTTSTTLTDSGPGATNNFTATVTSLGGNVPTGVVVFSVDGAVVGQGTLNASGVATFTDASFPTSGSHVITAAYQSDVKDGTSTGTLTQAAAVITSGNLLVDLVGTGASASISGIAESGTTATATTSAPHGFVVGQLVAITGASNTGYNKTFTIVSVPSSTTFTFTAATGVGSSTGGTATVNLNGNGTATFINEYTTGGTSVQSIALPSSGSTPFTEGGTFTTEGYVTDSSDGHSAVLGGYAVGVGSTTTGANGVVAVINANGSIESSTQIANADTTIGTTNSVRAVASADGLGFWVSTNNYIRYVPFGNNSLTPTTAVSNFYTGGSFQSSQSPNAVAISPSGQLYGDAGSAAQSNGVPANDGPFTVGSGLPTDGGSSATTLQGFPTTSGANGFPSSRQFVVSPDGNYIFVADARTNAGGGILLYAQSTPGNWVLIGNAFAGTTAGADTGLRGLTADFSNPAAPILYATTTASSGNRIVKITGAVTPSDPAFASASFLFTTVATAPANTAFRGVALAPTAPGATTSNTALAVSGSPATYGGGLTLTATVTGSGATPTGWVSFRAGGVEIGAVPLVNGKAVFTTAGNLNAAAYTNLVAVYTGNSAYSPSTSSVQSGTVNKDTPNVTLSETFSNVATGVVDSLTATIAVPPGTAPGGTVTFWDGTVGTGTNLGTVAVSQLIVPIFGNPSITFVATLSTTFTSVGTHNLSAVYSGDQNFGTATGTGTVTAVNPTTTTVTTSNVNPTASPAVNQTLTATVTSGGSGTVTGKVQFFDDLLPVGNPVNISGNNTGGAQATTTISTALLQAASGNADVLTPGLHSITAIYTPDTAAAGTYFTSTGVYEQAVQAQPFGANDQFVERVGDGTTNLIAQQPNPIAGSGSIGSTIFVDEYTPAGTLVQSIALPTADSQAFAIGSATESGNTVTITTTAPHNLAMGDTVTVTGVLTSGYNGTFTVTAVTPTTISYTAPTSNMGSSSGGTAAGAVHAVVGNGQQSTTGQMTLSGDGQFLFLTGYDNNPLPAATALPVPTASGNAAVPRAIARIKFDGTVQTEAFSGVDTGGNFNGVWSPDGNQFYVSGNNSEYYFSSLNPSASLQTATATITSGGFTGNGLEGVGGNLYIVQSGTANLVQQYTGFPTAAAALTSLPGVNATNATAGGQASQFTVDVYFTHLNGTNAPAGINTMYLADDGPSFAGGAITKWALVSGTWKVVDHITSGSGNSATTFYWLSGKTDGSGNVTLYATYGNGGNADVGPGYLYSIVDQNGYNAPIGTGGTHSDNVTTVAAVGGNDNLGLSTTANEVFRGVASVPVMAVTSVTTNANTTPIVSATESTTGGVTTVTVTTDGAHGFVVGESVVIAGISDPANSVPGYNGVVTITGVPDATDFTYIDANAAGLDVGSGGTATAAHAVTATISTAKSSGTTATITTMAPHGFTAGQVVTISGVSVGGYNGTFTIASVLTTNTFTYTTSGSNLSEADNSGSATLNSALDGPQRSVVASVIYTFNQPVTLGANAFGVTVHGTVGIATATESNSNTVTITTTTNHNFVTGQVITVAGVTNSSYNGTFTITVTGLTTFTYTDGTSGLGDSSGGTAGPGTAPLVSYLSPDGGTTWVVTYTGSTVVDNSITDGVYDLTLNQAAVTYNYSGATLTQSNRTLDTFYRLYGDVNGDGIVNNADNARLRTTFGISSGQAGYLASLDFNLDGIINNADNAQFRKRFGISYSGFNPTI